MSKFSYASRSIRAVAAAGALATGLTLVTVPTVAQADTNGCVTKREFKRVHNGMKMKRTHRIFDTGGKQSSVFTIGGDRYVSREYRACRKPRWSSVYVDFENGRVDGKMAFWG